MSELFYIVITVLVALIVQRTIRNVLQCVSYSYNIQVGQLSTNANKEEREHDRALKEIEKEERKDSRRSELEDKKLDQEHELKMQSQSMMHDILTEVYKKVPSADMSQAISCSYLLQSVSNGSEVNKDVLEWIGQGEFKPAISLASKPLPSLLESSKEPLELEPSMSLISSKQRLSASTEENLAGRDNENEHFFVVDEHLTTKEETFNSISRKTESVKEFNANK